MKVKVSVPFAAIEDGLRRVGEAADKINAAAVSVDRAARAWQGAARNVRWWQAAAWMSLLGKGS